MELSTERLLLRPIREDDVRDIFEYSKDESVGPSAGWKPHETLEETKLIMQEVFLNQENVFGIVWKEENRMIGTIGLIQDDKRQNDLGKMLGYAIGQNYWGKGIMTEAAAYLVCYGFDFLKLSLVSAYCYPFNERSKKVIEKLGFIYEGRLRDAERIYNGKLYDNLCFSITKEEYLKQPYAEKSNF